jgi:hypothetical protein
MDLSSISPSFSEGEIAINPIGYNEVAASAQHLTMTLK